MRQLTVIATCMLLFTACREAGNINPLTKSPDTVLPADTVKPNPLAPMDLSPMDIATYPPNHSVNRLAGKGNAAPYIRLIYSRPHKKNRVVFGEGHSVIVPYGKPWRLGANEATEIELLNNVNIKGNNLRAGRYTMYAIPGADKWTVVFSSKLYNWGLEIDSSKDVLRVDIPVQSQHPEIEDFTMFFEDTPSGAALNMVWDTVRTTLHFDFDKN